MNLELSDEIEGDLEITVLCRFKCGAVKARTAPVSLSAAVLDAAGRNAMDADVLILSVVDLYLEDDPGTDYAGIDGPQAPRAVGS